MNILLLFPGFIIAFIIAFYYEYKIRNLPTKPKNNVHFYVARDKNGSLWLYVGKPFRNDINFSSHSEMYHFLYNDSFSYFGLNENDYINLKWEDEPVEVFLNLND